MEPMRLQRFLALCGLGSRRHCEGLIERGGVRVNGETITRQGVTVDPASDRVEIGGRLLELPGRSHLYLVINKPRSVVVSASDELGRQTIFDLLHELPRRVFAVGRLDRDSEGLLIITSDGDLAHRLMHPRYEVEKEYLVTVRGAVPDTITARLVEGVPLEGGIAKVATAHVLQEATDRTRLSIVLKEGKNRQIRRMLEVVGLEVMRLKRVREGPIELDRLRPAASRSLTTSEVAMLKAEVGLEDLGPTPKWPPSGHRRKSLPNK